MAGSLGGGKVRGRYRPLAEINVTPLVDVMLVLLIVFMVAAPMMVVGVPVELPKTAAPRAAAQRPPVVLTVAADGKTFIRQEEVPRTATGKILHRVLKAQLSGGGRTGG